MTVPTGPRTNSPDRRSIPVTRASAGAEFGSSAVGVQAAPAGATAARATGHAARTVDESPAAAQPLSPRLDIVETADELLLAAELPGFDEDDIVLEAIDQQIRIFAERDGEDDVEDGRQHLRERLSRVERTVALPTPVDVERADASFEDGICRIEIPKIEESRAHRIGFH